MIHKDQAPSDSAVNEHPREGDIAFDLSGGLNLRDPPTRVPDGQLQQLLNMYYPRDTNIPQTRPGATALISNAGGDVTAIHVYRKSATTSYNCFTVINSTKQELWYQTGTDAPVLIEDDLGSLLTPSMVTFNGCLYVAIKGLPITEWQGETAANPTRGTASFTLTDNPTDLDTFTIGDETWTWKAANPDPLYEVLITSGGTAAADAEACAASMVTAINNSSSIVSAALNGGDPKIVVVTHRRLGQVATTTSESTTNGSWSGNVSAGASGLGVDTITTYQAPTPGFLVVDQNQRLVAAGDTTYPDRVYWSAPTNPWQWAYGSMGGGEIFDIGYLDGMDITAIQSMMGEMVIHKSGQGREIHRINTVDPDPSTWTTSMKRFHSNVAAVNHRCVVSVTDKHLMLDTRGFAALTGNDTYDQIGVRMAGEMVGKELRYTSASEAFFVVNPDENYLLIFPTKSKKCLVFHYGTGRWAEWEFKTAGNIICGCYSDTLETVLLGTDDNKVLELDAAYAVDDSTATAFRSVIETRAIGADVLSSLILKQTQLEWENLLQGDGFVELKAQGNGTLFTPDTNQRIFEFRTYTAEPKLLSFYAVHLDDWLTPLQAGQSYARTNSYNQGRGEIVSLVITLEQGAFAPYGLTARIAYHGRDGE